MDANSDLEAVHPDGGEAAEQAGAHEASTAEAGRELSSGPSSQQAGDLALSAPPHPPALNAFRSRIYELVEDGTWKDLATGFTTAEQRPVSAVDESGHEFFITVREQMSPTSPVLLDIPLSSDYIYKRQQGTIICLERPGDDEHDHALSFQEKNGCHHIWSFIANYLGAPAHLDQLPFRPVTGQDLLGTGEGSDADRGAGDTPADDGSSSSSSSLGSHSGSDSDSDSDLSDSDEAGLSSSSSSGRKRRREEAGAEYHTGPYGAAGSAAKRRLSSGGPPRGMPVVAGASLGGAYGYGSSGVSFVSGGTEGGDEAGGPEEEGEDSMGFSPSQRDAEVHSSNGGGQRRSSGGKGLYSSSAALAYMRGEEGGAVGPGGEGGFLFGGYHAGEGVGEEPVGSGSVPPAMGGEADDGDDPMGGAPSHGFRGQPSQQQHSALRWSPGGGAGTTGGHAQQASPPPSHGVSQPSHGVSQHAYAVGLPARVGWASLLDLPERLSLAVRQYGCERVVKVLQAEGPPCSEPLPEGLVDPIPYGDEGEAESVGPSQQQPLSQHSGSPGRRPHAYLHALLSAVRNATLLHARHAGHAPPRGGGEEEAPYERAVSGSYRLALELLRLKESTLIDTVMDSGFLFTQLMRAFDYSPYARQLGIRHSETAVTRARRRVAVPISDKDLVALFTQTFRYIYLRDSVLPRNFDESVMASLNSIVFMNQQSIINDVLKDRKLLDEIFATLRSPTTPGNAMERYAAWAEHNRALAEQTRAREAARAEALAARKARRTLRVRTTSGATAATAVITQSEASGTPGDGMYGDVSMEIEGEGEAEGLERLDTPTVAVASVEGDEDVPAAPLDGAPAPALQTTAQPVPHEAQVPSYEIVGPSTAEAPSDESAVLSSASVTAFASDAATAAPRASDAPSAVAVDGVAPEKACSPAVSATETPASEPVSPLAGPSSSSSPSPGHRLTPSTVSQEGGEGAPASSTTPGSAQGVSPPLGQAGSALAAQRIESEAGVTGGSDGGGSAGSDASVSTVDAVPSGMDGSAGSAGAAAETLAALSAAVAVAAAAAAAVGDSATALVAPVGVDLDVSTIADAAATAGAASAASASAGFASSGGDEDGLTGLSEGDSLLLDMEYEEGDGDKMVMLQGLGGEEEEDDEAFLRAAFPGDGPGALAPLALEEVDAPHSPREAALLFLGELSAIVRSLPPTTRAVYHRSLLERPLFPALEAVLGDRHASVREASAALELLAGVTAFDGAHLRDFRDYCDKQKRLPEPAPLHPPPGVKPVPVGAFPPFLPPGTPTLPSDALLAHVRTTVIDDGASIRLYEKLHALAAGGELGGLVTSVEELPRFNEARQPYGEHGRLLPLGGPKGDGRPLTMLHKLVWRAVDDPEPSIQSAALDLIRSLLEGGPGTAHAQPPDSLLSQAYDVYMFWLFTPFTCHALPAFIQPPSSSPAAAVTPGAKPGSGSQAGSPVVSGAIGPSSAVRAVSELAATLNGPSAEAGMAALEAAMEAKKAQVQAQQQLQQQRDGGQSGTLVASAASPSMTAFPSLSAGGPQGASPLAAWDLLLTSSLPAAGTAAPPTPTPSVAVTDGVVLTAAAPPSPPHQPPATPATPSRRSQPSSLPAAPRLTSGGTGFALVDPRDLREQVVPALAAGFGEGPCAPLGSESFSSKASKLGVMELLLAFLPLHSLRMRYFIVRSKLIGRTQRLLRYRERHVVLACVKLVRLCAGQKEPFYGKNLQSEGLLPPLAAAFLLRGGGNTLLNSAVLELLDGIAGAGARELAEVFSTTYAPLLAAAAYPAITTALGRVAKGLPALPQEPPASSNRGGADGGGGQQRQGMGGLRGAAGGWIGGGGRPQLGLGGGGLGPFQRNNAAGGWLGQAQDDEEDEQDDEEEGSKYWDEVDDEDEEGGLTGPLALGHYGGQPIIGGSVVRSGPPPTPPKAPPAVGLGAGKGLLRYPPVSHQPPSKPPAGPAPSASSPTANKFAPLLGKGPAAGSGGAGTGVGKPLAGGASVTDAFAFEDDLQELEEGEERSPSPPTASPPKLPTTTAEGSSVDEAIAFMRSSVEATGSAAAPPELPASSAAAVPAVGAGPAPLMSSMASGPAGLSIDDAEDTFLDRASFLSRSNSFSSGTGSGRSHSVLGDDDDDDLAPPTIKPRAVLAFKPAGSGAARPLFGLTVSLQPRAGAAPAATSGSEAQGTGASAGVEAAGVTTKGLPDAVTGDEKEDGATASM